MKKFLSRLLFFLLPLILIWGAIETFYRIVPNNYSFKNNKVKENYSDTQVLILGNSHSFYGINPDFFDTKAYNLSNISQSLRMDELLLNKHIDKFENLKYIVLNVDYFTLSQKDNYSESWRMYFYKEQMGLDIPEISDFDPKGYSLALAPRFDLTVDVLSKYLNEGSIVECLPNGWGQRQGIGPENSAFMGKIIAHKHEDGSLDFAHNIKRLNNIIKGCRDKKIKVLLVTMPVTTHYAGYVNKDKLKKIVNVCTKLTMDSTSVKYVNLFSDSHFNNNDFYDTDHLNIQGSKKCSEILNKYLQDW